MKETELNWIENSTSMSHQIRRMGMRRSIGCWDSLYTAGWRPFVCWLIRKLPINCSRFFTVTCFPSDKQTGVETNRSQGIWPAAVRLWTINGYRLVLKYFSCSSEVIRVEFSNCCETCPRPLLKQSNYKNNYYKMFEIYFHLSIQWRYSTNRALASSVEAP
jgi:hypothetical protein